MSKKVLELEQTKDQFLDIIERAGKAYTDAKYYQTDGFWRVFTSAADRELWESDPEAHADLVKWEFEGKTPRVIVVSGLTDIKYALAGTKGNTIDYNFWIEEADGSINHESMSVTYRFENEGNVQTATAIYAGNTQVSFNVDRYLREGTNNITMLMKSRSTGTVKTVMLTYYIMTLTLESNFNIASAIQYDKPIVVGCRTKASYQRVIHFIVDGIEKATAYIQASDVSDVFKQYQLENTYAAGLHSLQIYASMIVNEQTFVTDTYYYTFVIKDTSVIQRHVQMALTLDRGTIIAADTQPILQLTQYQAITIPWAYYSSNILEFTKVINWKLLTQAGQFVSDISSVSANSEELPDPLIFIPVVVGSYKIAAFASINGEEMLLEQYAANIYLNPNGIAESTERLMLKLQAVGRSNEEPAATRASWTYQNSFDTISTQFSNVDWNAQSGWYENALILTGDARANILYAPFAASDEDLYSPQVSGCVVELDFEIFGVSDSNATLITIGDMFGKIEVKTTSATMTSREGVSVKTNYKFGERIHLCFVVKPNTEVTERRLLYVINNGILERSNVYSVTDTFNSDGQISIGSNDAGIKIYGIRCYHADYDIDDAWNNCVIDDYEHISERIEDNDVYTDNTRIMSPAKVSAKIPTMFLTGDVDLLIAASNKTTVVLDAEWVNPQDPERNFTLKTANFRNHGQSTLGMPVPSMKFWSDKDQAQMFDVDGNRIVGGRYSFKEGVMPMKKWVLQANYMDSTGCHNGSILRLMSATWDNANVGNLGYALRTPPQKVLHDIYPQYNDGNPSPYMVS